MALIDEIQNRLREIFSSQWGVKDGRVVPETKDLGLGNVGSKIEATVLYADLDNSTNLVDGQTYEFSAEVYKAFLHLSTRSIRAEGGEVRSFDGDRVMGVFLGDSKNTSAAKAGLKINYLVKVILQPELEAVYPDAPKIKHTVGIDTSELLVVRAGIRGSNDLVWIGRAPNHAAKLNALSSEFATRVTAEVYGKMNKAAKFGGKPQRLMWEEVTWTSMNRKIYRSRWWWRP